MNASELLKSTQQFFVNSGLGVSREVEYRHEDGTQIPSLNVFVNELDVNKIKSDKSSAVAVLTNVYLTIEPNQNDRVRFAGEADVWRVQSWRKQDGAYILNIATKRYQV